MVPLNQVLNRVDAMTLQTSNAFKSQVCSRATNLFIAAPVEVAAVAQNILLTPVMAASVVLKAGVKAAALVTGSQALKNFEAKLPGAFDLLKTIVRIAAYAIGAVITATLGVISPKTNFDLHCRFSLALNRKEIIVEDFRELAEDNTFIQDVTEKDDINKSITLNEETTKENTTTNEEPTTHDELFDQEQAELNNLTSVFIEPEQIETIVETIIDDVIEVVTKKEGEDVVVVNNNQEHVETTVDIKNKETEVTVNSNSDANEATTIASEEESTSNTAEDVCVNKEQTNADLETNTAETDDVEYEATHEYLGEFNNSAGKDQDVVDLLYDIGRGVLNGGQYVANGAYNTISDPWDAGTRVYNVVRHPINSFNNVWDRFTNNFVAQQP